ncbi:hypothetical protein [Kitasatospora sp. GP82]|uniref:hypothetical protein n=1 Tax=Kitasatospora sp. GP82 TaxID=3035089 RepID=UPI0024749F43|nr:hypothetical protein [Kitasatospora sp. GP82]MDH6130465.1 hypothetical protein [Kitasatospora sp. GP82]
MHSQETPEPSEGGLSTQDLAGARQDTGEQAPESWADSPPAFPGEATATDRERGEQETAADDREKGDDQPSEPGEDAEAADESEPLLGSEQEEFHSRWQKIQSEFVDDPRNAVHAADTLVAEAMQALATTFAEHKQDLEGQWNRGDEVPTEELRIALRRYRSFFNRLLST